MRSTVKEREAYFLRATDATIIHYHCQATRFANYCGCQDNEWVRATRRRMKSVRNRIVNETSFVILIFKIFLKIAFIDLMSSYNQITPFSFCFQIKYFMYNLIKFTKLLE